MKDSTQMKAIYGIVPRKNGDGGYWTKIGVAFVNKDGSMNLRFDFVPSNPETTIQVRDFEPKRDEAPSSF